MNDDWQPSVGAALTAKGVRFRIWAPDAKQVEVVLEPGDSHTMQKQTNGVHELVLPTAKVGTRYRYRVDGNGPFPDPASRFQPEGVHGPSQVIDSHAFAWKDSAWRGPDAERLTIYELHVGTFTPEGNYAAATKKLPLLKELGVSAIELMPLADFPGARGWGYDGVALYAPARCYGTPDELRALVDAAHALGLAVLLDAVYNHLGPDGNYLGCYSSFYFSTTHKTDWGTGPNFDGELCEHVVEFFIQNAEQWIRDYHFDGLRLDATHAILDDGEKHFLQHLTQRVHDIGLSQNRTVVVIAEDERNHAALVQPLANDGFNLDGVWADDLHHQLRRAFAGDVSGYYADYTGSAQDIATTLNQGWFYSGQPTVREKKPRGSDSAGIPPHKFIVCIQNHDQIGNRAFGERLNHQVDPSSYRAASTFLLFAPQTPLIYMGQEWAASSPFQYFTEHNAELGKLVTEGRRHEFRHFPAFADPLIREHIPDPQSEFTFNNCKLKWEERELEPHAHTLALYRDLLELRKTELALAPRGKHEAQPLGDGIVIVRRSNAAGTHTLILLVAIKPGAVAAIAEPGLEVVYSSESKQYTNNPRQPDVTQDDQGTVVHFPCPAALLLRPLSATSP